MKIAIHLLFFCFISEIVWANDFSAVIRNVQVESIADSYQLNTDITYTLSPVAKDALHKGIALTWMVIIRVEKVGDLWHSTLAEVRRRYQIKNHALLSLYSVKQLNKGEKDMYSSLSGALNSISKIRNLSIVDKFLIKSEQQYRIAIKVQFEHEALPVPMRPFSYFDSQWALSSRWTLWPLEN